MTRRVKLRRRARRDLDEIWSYSLANWGRQQAEQYILDINAVFDLAARNPGLARDAAGIGRPGLKKIVAGSHVVYLHIDDDAIDVIRILHSRMDPGRHL